MGVLFLYNVFCVGFLFYCLFDSPNLLSFWFVLEFLSIGVVPYFFFPHFIGGQRCLYQYLLVMVASSVFLVSGVLFDVLRVFLLGVGVLLKLGVFPFMAWVYEVVIYGGWSTVWVVTGLLKIPFFLFFYFRGSGGFDSEVFSLCFWSFACLSVGLWGMSFSWRHCWCHIAISGSAGLVVVALSCCFETVLNVFYIYVLWVTLSLCYNSLKEYLSVSVVCFAFLSLFISFPPSFAFIYKLALGVSMLSSPLPVFGVWGLYSVSEQFYLVYYYLGGVKGGKAISFLSSV